MDFVFWIIVIVLIIGVVWWLLNRSNSSKGGGSVPGRAEGGLSRGSAAASAEAAGTTGIPGAAGFGSPAEPAPPTTADEAPEPSRPAEPRETAAATETVGEPAHAEPEVAGPAHGVESRDAEPGRGATPDTADVSDKGAATDRGAAADRGAATEEGEWETQWSEADGSAHAATHRPVSRESSGAGATQLPKAPPAAGASYVHHAEYTEAHSPTLPGAETAAAEAADEARETEPAAPVSKVAPAGTHAAPGTALPDDGPETETSDRTRSSAAVETAASHQAGPPGTAVDHEGAAEPAGHLAADQPYGAGSASPAPDGSGPADFDVKGDAGAMVYYEEGHADYEQIRADVWFESPAHAEAAGFRAPRRMRL